MKILVGIDLQNDFFNMALGCQMFQDRIDVIANKIRTYQNDYELILTLDTHNEDYLTTLEGMYLPVPHCIGGTDGHKIVPAVWDAIDDNKVFSWFPKNTFGGLGLPNFIKKTYSSAEEIEEIQIIGVCTSICVMANAVILRAAFPNTRIVVDASCCADVNFDKHYAALSVLEAQQIEIINR